MQGSSRQSEEKLRTKCALPTSEVRTVAATMMSITNACPRFQTCFANFETGRNCVTSIGTGRCCTDRPVRTGRWSEQTQTIPPFACPGPSIMHEFICQHARTRLLVKNALGTPVTASRIHTIRFCENRLHRRSQHPKESTKPTHICETDMASWRLPSDGVARSGEERMEMAK